MPDHFRMDDRDRQEVTGSIQNLIELFEPDAEQAATHITAAIIAAGRRDEWDESPSFAFVLAFAAREDKLADIDE